jgi:hypothetical protein
MKTILHRLLLHLQNFLMGCWAVGMVGVGSTKISGVTLFVISNSWQFSFLFFELCVSVWSFSLIGTGVVVVWGLGCSLVVTLASSVERSLWRG